MNNKEQQITVKKMVHLIASREQQTAVHLQIMPAG